MMTRSAMLFAVPKWRCQSRSRWNIETTLSLAVFAESGTYDTVASQALPAALLRESLSLSRRFPRRCPARSFAPARGTFDGFSLWL